MDFATKLFSLSLGVEPNKATLKELSDTLNSAVLSLADKQKALEKYAETAQSQSYVVQAPVPKQEVPKQKPPVVWQISQAKLKELQWKRAQLRQFEREKAAYTKKAPSTGPSPKSSQAKNPSKRSSVKQSNIQGEKGNISQAAASPVTQKAKSSLKPLKKPTPQPKAGDSESKKARN